MFFAKIKVVLREIFSEPNGGGLSWGRCASTLALIIASVWVTRLVILTHSLPALDGITGFIVAPYGANKIGTAVQSFSQNPVSFTPGTMSLNPNDPNNNPVPPTPKPRI